MPLDPGTRLGPYEVLALIGAGGMGEVYKARDTRLDRTVALKILPPDFAADPDPSTSLGSSRERQRDERRQRFEREARAISALNHPHICTLYDVGEADLPSTEPRVPFDSAQGKPSNVSVSYLVMEYLEGETLADRLRRGALPLEQALSLATEIAEALSAAHRQGIIHRDLKPGNVMLTKTGTKLLDFGLAKLRGHGDRPAADTLVSAPTQSGPLTGQGTIVGTLQYMAPEQLEGKPIDARTDLFAFGAIVYEMVTGQRAFEAASAASLIGAIMSSEPPAVATLQPLTPPAVDRLVRKCLAKAPDDRWDTAHDVADELRWVRESSAALAAASPAGRRTPRRREVAVIVAALALVATTAGLTWLLTRPAPAPPRAVQRFLIDTSPAEGLRGPNELEERIAGLNRPSRTAIALSPDGASLVFSAIRGERVQLYHRKLAESVAVPLNGTEGAEGPFFSPDGQWVGFWAREALWKMRLDGTAPIELCATPPPAGASWSSKGTIAFGDSNGTPAILVIPAAGGPPKPVITVDAAHGEMWHSLPHFLPDGETLLFTVGRDWMDPKSASVAAVSLTSGKRTTIVDGATDARYLPTGHLVYVRLGRLEAVPFDPVRVAVTGEAVGLIPDVMQALNTGDAGAETGAAQLTTSATGTLVYVTGGIVPDRRSELVWVDRRGVIVETLRIPRGPYTTPRLSPDNRRILYAKTGMNGSLWSYDVARQISTMIPTTEAQPWGPIWMPDGQRVMFSTPVGGYTRLHIVPVDGSTPSEMVGGDVPPTASEVAGSWTPDGKTLIFVRQVESPEALWQLHMDGGPPRRSLLLGPPASTKIFMGLNWPAVSPDGHWLAYVSDESGRNEVYVQRFPDLGGRQQVSRESGRAPVWRRDGRELFYVEEGTRRMMAVDVRPGSGLSVGLPQVLFEITDDLRWGTYWLPAYDVSMDGQRVLFVRRSAEPIPPPPSQMHVVLNWFEELKAKVPTGR